MHQQTINKGGESSPMKRLKYDPLSILDDPEANNDDNDEIKSMAYSLAIT